MNLSTKLARLCALTVSTAFVAAAAQAATDPAGQPVNGMPEVPNPPMHQVQSPNSQATPPQTTPQGGMQEQQQHQAAPNAPNAPTTRSTPWAGRHYQSQEGATGTTTTTTTHHRTTTHHHHRTHHKKPTPSTGATQAEPTTEPTTPH